MRIKLTLQPGDKNCTIPINYQYPLSAAIYKILESACSDYADFLHRKGYISPGGKPFKLFTFSKIFINDYTQYQSILQIRPGSRCTLYISSPLLEDFIQNFVIGLFQRQEIEIGGPQAVGQFVITKVETLAIPQFSTEMKFRCLSPITVSTMHHHQGKLTPYYYRPNDDRLSQAIVNNLKQKYETIFHKSPDQLFLNFEIDQVYLAHREQQGKRVTKKITIKETDTEHATDIISFEAPFTLTGSTELMQTAYECGIGEKNSMGFGMIEIVR